MHRLAPLAAILASATPALAQDPTLIDRLGRTAGRLHPIAVHFPIALITTACLIEFFRAIRRKPQTSPAATTCLAIGAAGACFAAFSGWMNASYETVTSNTAEIHRWLGVSLAILSTLLAIIALILRTGIAIRLYRLGLIIAAGLVAYGGHLGGVLTHGENYITDALADLFSPRQPATPLPLTPAAPLAPLPKNLAEIKFPADGKIDFNRDVRPIFALACYECHGEKKRKGALRMDVKAAALEGGKGGPLFIPGKPEESQLIERVKGLGEEQRMPADNPALPEDCIRILEAWVTQGANWPDDGLSKSHGEEEKHWAFIAPIKHTPTDKSAHPIDTFIRAKLRDKKLTPNPEASPETLIRRVTLDLTGLPPTVEEVEAFLADTQPNAYSHLVDRLLASPRYGEHMARSWLDLARYADSNGYEKDGSRSIWPYRDWVISALNADMPFDQFTLEQLAGDLLPNPTQSQLIATGFNRNSMINEEGGVDPEEYRVNAVIDRANTTATVWLGQTLACAQCHDHKFDPFTQKDYYSFFAFFNDTPEESRLATGSEFQEISPKLTLSDEHDDRRAQIKRLEAFIKEVGDSSAEALVSKQQLEDLRHQTPAATTTLVMRPLDQPRTTRILNRGSFLSPGDAVEPDVPAALKANSKLQESTRPTRASLARWLTDPQNPLTARVTVNRIWEHHFSRGLVETSEDFGTRGTPPTHPHLLDYLAQEFIARNWSFKQLHKLIVTSATYKQSSTITPKQLELDPQNLWLSRAPRPRLTGETIRDQALAISGLLSTKMGGPPVFPVQPEGIWQNPYSDNRYTASQGDDRHRRSIYTYWKRSSPYPSFITFDAPTRQVTCTRRPTTNTPLQALTTLNDPIYIEAAAALAGRITSLNSTDFNDRLNFATKACLARSPDSAERFRLQSLFESQLAIFRQSPTEAQALLKSVLENHTPSDSDPELASWTILANVLLNLDELLTRG